MDNQPEEKLALVLKVGRIGTWVLSLPERILVCSDTCKANYGYLPSDLFPYETLLESMHLDDRGRVAAMIAGAIIDGTEFATEYRCKWPDGSAHWIAVHALVIRDKNGNAKKLTGVTQNITERKQTEIALQDAQIRITSMLDTVEVATWSLDLVQDRVTPDRNLMRMFYLTEDEAHGSVENYLRQIHPNDRPMVEAAMREVFANANAKYALQYRIVGPGGLMRWIDIRGTVERDAAGKPILFRGVVLDITDRKAAEELQSRLAISHRLLKIQEDERRRVARELHDSAGQTLAAVGMTLQMIVSRAKREAPSVVASAQECSELIQQLSGEIRMMSYLLHPPMLDEVGLSGALGWYVEGLEGRSGMKINVETPANFPRIDKELELAVFRVVQECLTNIYRHSGSKTASIQLSTNDHELRLEIVDQGKGMTAEKLRAVQTKGTGVGLQGMRERVRQHGGRMEIRSDDGGTKLSFQFPVANQNTAVDRHNETRKVTGTN